MTLAISAARYFRIQAKKYKKRHGGAFMPDMIRYNTDTQTKSENMKDLFSHHD